MPHRKSKALSSLFRSAAKARSNTCSKPSSIPADDASLKQFVSSLDICSEILTKSPEKSSFPGTGSGLGDSDEQLYRKLSSIVAGVLPDSKLTNDEKPLEKGLTIPWLTNLSQANLLLRRKELSRVRKQKWVFKNTQGGRLGRLVELCGERLGAETTIQVFSKLKRETGVKEYNALLGVLIKKARTCDDEEAALEQIYKAFQLFKEMKEQGFQIEEETYGPFLMYLIDMGMIEEFHFFCEVITDGNSRSLSRLGYYEMLLWVKVNNEEKIQELCNGIAADEGTDKPDLAENYVLALCGSDRKDELLKMLEIIDITKVSSLESVAIVFKSLGRLSLEAFMEKFVLTFKACDYGVERISDLICYYVTNMPNLAVEDVVLKFKDLHKQLVVAPTATSYNRLITYCCDSFKVHEALDIVDQMCEAGLALSIEMLHSILRASEESFEFNLVHRVYSVICHQSLEPNCETFRIMINLHAKMKDFDGAYDLLKEMKERNLSHTAGIYNAIMAGFFREKNIYGALMVLKQMEHAGVKPDSQTFCYLLNHCECEEDINKYYEKLKCAGVQMTKQVYMALLNAYANCRLFEKAKQVVLDEGVPLKSLNEIKSVLASSLAINGQISDAFNIYEEIKDSGSNLEPKAIISLIENCQFEGELTKLLQLLEELHDPDYRVEGCCRILLYCVRYDHLSTAIDLLKQLKDTFHDNELAMEATLDEVFCLIAETKPVNLKIGLDLLTAIKEELDLRPSRKSLDFLLAACVNSKDLCNARLVWKEYRVAGFTHNVLSLLRKYQAFLACGDHKSAANFLHKIPKNDPHVRCVIEACQTTYAKSSVKSKKKKEDEEKEEGDASKDLSEQESEE